MSARMCGKRAFLRRRVSTPLDAQHEHPDCASREMPVQVMTSAFPRVWLATTPRASNAARKADGNLRQMSFRCTLFKDDHVLDVGGRTFASPSPRGHPRRCRSPRRAEPTRYLSISSPRTTSACSRYPRSGVPSPTAGNFTEKSREPRVPRDFHESRNLRRTSPFVTSTPVPPG